MKSIGWGFILKVLCFLAAAIICLLAVFLFLLGVISFTVAVIVVLLVIALLAVFFVIAPELFHLSKLGKVIVDVHDQASFVSPGLLELLEVKRQEHDLIRLDGNITGLWTILRDQLQELYLWDLKYFKPTGDVRTYMKPEHQYFVVMLPRGPTGEVKNIVEMLNLRALHPDPKIARTEIAWCHSVPVTDFSEFEQMMEAGIFDRNKKPSFLPIEGVTAQVRI